MKTSALFAMPDFGSASAPVVLCGILRTADALGIYNFDYTDGIYGVLAVKLSNTPHGSILRQFCLIAIQRCIHVFKFVL